MAFNRENLSIATNHIKAGSVPSLWTYYNSANDNVIAANFFAERRLTIGDQIVVYQNDYNSAALYRVSAKATDESTATAVRSTSEYLSAGSSEAFTVDEACEVISLVKPISLITTAAAALTDTITATVANDYITASTDDLYDGLALTLTTTDTLPAGLAVLTTYYTVNSSGKTAQLSATRDGTAIDITDTGTGVHTLNVTKNSAYLADGEAGQEKIIKIEADGGVDLELIPENLADGDIITFGDVNDSVKLQFVDSTWQIVANNGVAAS